MKMEHFEHLKKQFNSQDYTFMLINGNYMRTSIMRGIKPMFEAVATDGLNTKGALVADRVLGKAGALLAVYGGIKAVYSPLLTQGAVAVFQAYKVYFESDKVVEAILNREKTGLCPMEQLAHEVINPQVMVDRVQHFLESLGK